MNYILINDHYYLTVPPEKKKEFNSGMIDLGPGTTHNIQCLHC